jgi:hypothetical protein
MPGRHSPPPAAESAAEKLKRQKKSGSKENVKGFKLSQGEADSLSHSKTRSKTPNPSEKLNTAAIPPPPQKLSGATPSEPPTQVSSNKPNSPKGEESIAKPGIITVDGIDFHHESEAEFARLLNYYGIEWQYEPHPFALQWRDGRPTEMFTPDFYLTEYDLYIELTTMRQSLVRRKNRKLRLLRALYPEINIKLIYRRDYQRLLERFGIKPDEMETEQPPMA